MTKNLFRPILAVMCCLVGLQLSSGCAATRQSDALAEEAGQRSDGSKTPLVVFCAGSLIIPFADLEAAFEAQHPEIDVLNECHGSIQVIRHVTDIHKEIDVVATADHALIPMLMYDTLDPNSNLPYANWYIRFASNELVLAYSDKGKYADEINEQNWYEVLTRPDVRVGLSDPRFDASGYRTLMIFVFAEEYYQHPKLFSAMYKDQFTSPVTIFYDDSETLITVPEILETRPDSHVVLRGASIQLIALLQSGDLDYAFEYKSVVMQHDLKMIELPDMVNMGSEEYAAQYEKVRVLLDFQRFATVKPEFTGERIGYGITIPSNAPHPQEAAEFIAFLLSEEGRKVMEADHHPMYNPSFAHQYENLPDILQAVSVPETE